MSGVIVLVHLVHSEDESISTELRRFWEIESLGILDKGSMTLGNGDEEILSEFDKSVNFVDGRYRVNLPWKPGMREALQNNKTVAHFRDRDFTRFFWTDNLNKEPYVLNFTRVLFGLRPSPYLLAATLKHHFKKYREQYPHTFELLNSSIYVDDLICGQNDVPDALRTTLSACKYSVTQACYCANGEVIRNNLICYGSKKVSKRNPLKLVLLILDLQRRFM
ncbi:uncharacterized protein TNCV_4683811 [Trichonephila clavipes]|nr:uncharacterized protein TNCV_4683811 [Trichonephila clavipes]